VSSLNFVFGLARNYPRSCIIIVIRLSPLYYNFKYYDMKNLRDIEYKEIIVNSRYQRTKVCGYLMTEWLNAGEE